MEHCKGSQDYLKHNLSVMPRGNQRQDMPLERFRGRHNAHVIDVLFRANECVCQLPPSRETDSPTGPPSPYADGQTSEHRPSWPGTTHPSRRRQPYPEPVGLIRRKGRSRRYHDRGRERGIQIIVARHLHSRPVVPRRRRCHGGGRVAVQSVELPVDGVP